MNYEDLKEGALLGGRYRLAQQIGAGGMGKVFRAIDERLDREVAVKVQLAQRQTVENADARFVREARVGAQLSHPNLVQTYDFGAESEFRYLVIELLKGEDLCDCLRLRGTLPLVMVADIAMQVSSGMAEAHDKGLVHRDLKPENIFLVQGSPMIAKVVDFGMAVATDSTGPMGRLTMEGSVGGTPWYMAPESFRREPTEAPADVYALGCVIYEMLSGTPPFNAEGIGEVVAHHLYAPVPDLAERRPDVSALLRELTLRCLLKNPAARPSMVQVHQRLVAEKSDRNRKRNRGQAPTPRPPISVPEELIADPHGPSHSVAIRGDVPHNLEITLRAAGFQIVSEVNLSEGDALVCFGMPSAELSDVLGAKWLVLADADPGDTKRVTELLRLGVDEVVARPTHNEDVVRKLRRAFRKYERIGRATR